MKRSLQPLLTVISISLSIGALIEVGLLERRLKHVVFTDALVVPSRLGMFRSTAGIATSNDDEHVALWLGRIDSNAESRLTSYKDGRQSLDFYDRRGKLRLSVGLNSSGDAQVQVFDKDGRQVSANTLRSQ